MSSENYLWLNKNVKFKKRPLFDKTLVEAGVTEYNQLLKPNGQYQTYDEVCEINDIAASTKHSLKFYELLNALPRVWDQIHYKGNARTKKDITMLKDHLKDYAVSTKVAYQYFIQQVKEYPEKRRKKWEGELNLTSNFDWSNICQSNYYSTVETKLRSFQIKLNLRAVVTNACLFHFGMIDSPNCVFCNTETDSLVHMFTKCKMIESFWENINGWIVAKFRKPLIITDDIKVFGIQHEKSPNLINCILLGVRFYIYRCKVQKHLPNVDSCIDYINEIRKTEKAIAMKSSTLAKHLVKWSSM